MNKKEIVNVLLEVQAQAYDLACMEYCDVPPLQLGLGRITGLVNQVIHEFDPAQAQAVREKAIRELKEEANETNQKRKA